MRLLDLMRRESSASWQRVMFVGAIAGISGALVLAIINEAAAHAADREHSFRNLALFGLVLLLYIISQNYIMTTSARDVENILHKIRVRLADKIRYCDLLAFERIGRSQIYASVTKETQIISQTATVLVIGAQSAVLAFFTFIYIAWQSIAAFLLSIIFITIALSIHFRRRRELNASMHESLARENRMLDALTDMLDGLKEVKMNSMRGDELYQDIDDISQSATDLKIDTQTKLASYFIFSQTAFYLLLATIVFLVPKLSATYSDVVIKITTATLFLIGPISSLVSAIPVVAQANATAENIFKLESLLDEHARRPLDRTPEIKSFDTIKLEGVTFDYSDPSSSGADTFRVGPITLEIPQGQMLFISGGNGSGKSTFLKLLVGLYYPKEGTIRVDKLPINLMNYDAYRNLFSVIFIDYHLFRRLYGLGELDREAFDKLLSEMELESKTRLIDGEFETLDLSGGQRQRLALMISLLERKKIYVFDEWAANQDPEFRRKFYEEILPGLKNEGKTIIAITHDDKYFGVADRHVRMEDGRFVGL